MLLSLDDITIRLSGGPAFEHTTWTIRRDEHWAILGPTGAGKSLLAAALSRRVPLCGGEIRYYFDGTSGPEVHCWPRPGEIMTLSAETHRAFVGRYAVYHQARWQGAEAEGVPVAADLLDRMGAPAAGRDEVVRLLGLDPLLRRRVLHLSHGESRGLHLAYLLLERPRLLILDDPYAGLDRDARAHFARTIEDLLRRGRPHVLFIGSRPEEVPAGTHRILLVRGLRVQAQLDASEFRETETAVSSSRMQLSGNIAEAPFAASFAEETVSTELVRMEHVAVSYGRVRVLNGLSWRVVAGERWWLSGPNGSGKTTLLSLILGDNPQAYANEIYLFGRRRGSGESIWEIKKKIGWLSPELQIHYPGEATCFEAVASGLFDSVGLFRSCTPEQSACVERWLEALDLHGHADTPFQTLSAGQQRLALLARALVKSPPLLVLDEPCQGLDTAHRGLLNGLLDRICLRVPLTMIYVTHYPDEVPSCITHHLRLSHGLVAECRPVHR